MPALKYEGDDEKFFLSTKFGGQVDEQGGCIARTDTTRIQRVVVITMLLPIVELAASRLKLETHEDEKQLIW